MPLPGTCHVTTFSQCSFCTMEVYWTPLDGRSKQTSPHPDLNILPLPPLLWVQGFFLEGLTTRGNNYDPHVFCEKQTVLKSPQSRGHNGIDQFPYLDVIKYLGRLRWIRYCFIIVFFHYFWHLKKNKIQSKRLKWKKKVTKQHARSNCE